MLSTSKIPFIALIVLGWNGVALGDDRTTPDMLEPSVFAAIANMELDSAFERATSPIAHDIALPDLAGTTTMLCREGAARGDLETCVVTGSGDPRRKPAALAQH